MGDVHINMGSNENRVLKLTLALKAVEQEFSHVVISSLYESPAEGFEGNDFYNIGINATTDKSSHEVRAALKKIEDDLGRDRNLTKFSARIIDLDLVLYDDAIEASLNLPRADILKYGYVLAPLAELSASKQHPIEGKTYQELWQAFQLSRNFVLSQYNIDKLFK